VASKAGLFKGASAVVRIAISTVAALNPAGVYVAASDPCARDRRSSQEAAVVGPRRRERRTKRPGADARDSRKVVTPEPRRPPPNPSLSDEVAALQVARTALAGHDASGARRARIALKGRFPPAGSRPGDRPASKRSSSVAIARRHRRSPIGSGVHPKALRRSYPFDSEPLEGAGKGPGRALDSRHEGRSVAARDGNAGRSRGPRLPGKRLHRRSITSQTRRSPTHRPSTPFPTRPSLRRRGPSIGRDPSWPGTPHAGRRSSTRQRESPFEGDQLVGLQTNLRVRTAHLRTLDEMMARIAKLGFNLIRIRTPPFGGSTSMPLGTFTDHNLISPPEPRVLIASSPSPRTGPGHPRSLPFRFDSGGTASRWCSGKSGEPRGLRRARGSRTGNAAARYLRCRIRSARSADETETRSAGRRHPELRLAARRPGRGQ
jgi:hypothetical protein